MNPLITISILSITVLFGGGVLLYLRLQKKKSAAVNVAQQTAQDMTNIKDIRNNYLYTQNGLVMMYIKVHPINHDLYSEREKKHLTRRLSAQFAGDRSPFKFFAVSRTTDISPLLADYEQRRTNTGDAVRRRLLRDEMSALAEFSLSGDAVERRFYFCIWRAVGEQVEKEISNRANEFVSRFQNAGIIAEIIDDREIAQLINLLHNPAYAQSNVIDSLSFKATIPQLIL